MIRVESFGSVWILDEDGERYMRMPKTEAGRERAEWGDATAGPLEDLRWLPLTRWALVPPFTSVELMPGGWTPENATTRLWVLSGDDVCSAPVDPESLSDEARQNIMRSLRNRVLGESK